MNIQKYFTNDRIVIPFKLRIDGLPFAITPATVVEGILLDCNGKQTTDGKKAIIEGEAGSDWRNSLVMFAIESGDSADIVPGRYRLMVNVVEIPRTFIKSEAFEIQAGQVV
jgi:hypothetical protein